MKDKLLSDIELKLSLQFPADQRERIMHCVITSIKDYDVTERVTDLTVRHEDINERILKRYVASMRLDGIKESTISQYVRTAKKLEELIGKPYTEMSAYDIRYFLGEIKARGSKNRHVESQRAYVSALFGWMYSEELIDKNPCAKIKPIKVEKEIRMPFTQVEIDRMRAACYRPMYRALLETLLSSGIRRMEACNLLISDVDLEKRILHVKQGKGSKDRTVYISEVAAEHIKIYLSKRNDDNETLFIGIKTKEKLSVNGVDNIVWRIGAKADVKGAHPHRFRRTFATEMRRRGMDIHSISKLMGHSTISTTERYIYSADDQLQAEYKKFSA